MHCGAGPAQGASKKMLSVEEMRENAAGWKNQNQLMLPNNVAFQLLFDFCLVDLLPRRAFFPWRPLPTHKVRHLSLNLNLELRMNPSESEGSPV